MNWLFVLFNYSFWKTCNKRLQLLLYMLILYLLYKKHHFRNILQVLLQSKVELIVEKFDTQGNLFHAVILSHRR